MLKVKRYFSGIVNEVSRDLARGFNMDMPLHSEDQNNRTETLMFEADRLLGNADVQEIARFDALMRTGEERDWSFEERLELALQKLRTGALPEGGCGPFH